MLQDSKSLDRIIDMALGALVRELEGSPRSGENGELDKLRAFKAYVHKRLDEADVPTDPPSPHKERGCRIGGRLDWLFRLLASLRGVEDTEKALRAEVKRLRADQDVEELGRVRKLVDQQSARIEELLKGSDKNIAERNRQIAAVVEQRDDLQRKMDAREVDLKRQRDRIDELTREVGDLRQVRALQNTAAGKRVEARDYSAIPTGCGGNLRALDSESAHGGRLGVPTITCFEGMDTRSGDPLTVYAITWDGRTIDGGVRLPFQHGEVKERGWNGVTMEALLAIVQDRLKRFQAGPYPAAENDAALAHVQCSIEALAVRTRRLHADKS